MKALYEGILSNDLEEKIDSDVKIKTFMKFAQKYNKDSGTTDPGVDQAHHKIKVGDPVMFFDVNVINFGVISKIRRDMVTIDDGQSTYEIASYDCLAIPMDIALKLARYLNK